MLTLKVVTTIKSELEGAFKPLHCIVRVYNSGEKVSGSTIAVRRLTAWQRRQDRFQSCQWPPVLARDARFGFNVPDFLGQLRAGAPLISRAQIG